MGLFPGQETREQSIQTAENHGDVLEVAIVDDKAAFRAHFRRANKIACQRRHPQAADGKGPAEGGGIDLRRYLQKKVEAGVLLKDLKAAPGGTVPKALEQAAAQKAVVLAHSAKMFFKIAFREEQRQCKLFRSWNGATVKAQAAFILLHKLRRQHQIADAERRRNGSGEGVEVEDPAAPVQALECGDGQAGKAEFSVIVVLDEEAAPVPPAPRRAAPAAAAPA